MSEPQQVPPWLQEHLQQLGNLQQNHQVIAMQKQQIDMERMETEKALEALKAAGDAQPVYKQAGAVLIRSSRKAMVDELEERKALAVTRAEVLSKQEARLRQALQDKDRQIQSMLQGGPQAGGAAGIQPAAAGGVPPPPPPPSR